MLSTDSLRDWYAIVQLELRRLVMKASVDGHSELIQNPLRYVQPMQISSTLYTTVMGYCAPPVVG